MPKNHRRHLTLILLWLLLCCCAWAQEENEKPSPQPAEVVESKETEEAEPEDAEKAKAEALRKAAQNPIASMISLPLQGNLLFGAGPREKTAAILNIQPVIPFGISQDWNVVSRTIIPVIYAPNSLFQPNTATQDILPDFTGAQVPFNLSSGELGIGDINQTFFFSPAQPGKWIWGVGPTVNLPTGSPDKYGSGKFSAGPAAVVLTSNGPVTYGALVNNVWSFAGDGGRGEVSKLTVQPFLNYNLDKGWYLTSSPVITANWQGSSGDKWTVPIGGGVGRITKLGKQPVNIQFQGFYHAVRPNNGPDWSIRFQLVYLFPK